MACIYSYTVSISRVYIQTVCLLSHQCIYYTDRESSIIQRSINYHPDRDRPSPNIHPFILTSCGYSFYLNIMAHIISRVDAHSCYAWFDFISDGLLWLSWHTLYTLLYSLNRIVYTLILYV